MLHMTCAAHVLHRVAEQVRSHFSTVDKLIGSVKEIFKKNLQVGCNYLKTTITTQIYILNEY